MAKKSVKRLAKDAANKEETGTLAALAAVYQLKMAVIDQLREKGAVNVEVDGIKATYLSPSVPEISEESTETSKEDAERLRREYLKSLY